MNALAIIGIGMHPFGRTPTRSGRQQAVHAVSLALADAGLDFTDMQFAYGGSAAAGQADTLVNELGRTGLPFINVANGCATGGSAMVNASLAIASGRWELGLVVGFDKHPRGSFDPDPSDFGMEPWYGQSGMMIGPQFFAMKIQRYMNSYDISSDTLERVACKAFRNGALNPNAWRRDALPIQTVKKSPMIAHPLRKHMFCSPSEGAVACIVAHPRIARRHSRNPIFVSGAALTSRREGSFEVWSPEQAIEVAPSPSVFAAREALERAAVEPADIDLAQLQDTEAGAEVMHMAETSLCKDGEQEALISQGETDIGGRLPVNTDGGCIANGEPVGASGLRQIYETVVQLRGQAGKRQVPGNPRVGFTHVYGAPGVSACAVLHR